MGHMGEMQQDPYAQLQHQHYLRFRGSKSKVSQLNAYYLLSGLTNSNFY